MTNKKRECLVCKEEINLFEDLFVVLETYNGKKMVEEVFFHMECWRKHFEERARQKAEAVVSGMKERMMPIASQLMGKLNTVIEQRKNE